MSAVHAKENELAMRIENALTRVAIGCAIFLLFGPIGGRTTWVEGNRNGTTTTDAAGYNVAALFSGVVALAALGIAFWARPRVVVPVLAAVVAVAAFGLSVVASGVYVWARWQGEIWFYGAGGFAGDLGRNETVYPAWGPPFFATAALIGAVSAHALAVLWLRPPRGT